MSQSRDIPNRKVLLVDDNRQLLRAIRLKLELDCFDVVTSETGDEAIAMLETGLCPDIVLTDAVMPGETQGTDLARYSKSHHPKVPVVLMSGYLGAADRQVTGLPEIDCFLPKPLALSDLSAVFDRLLRRQLAEAEPVEG